MNTSCPYCARAINQPVGIGRPRVTCTRKFCRERHKRTLADIPKPEFGYRKLTPLSESLFPVKGRS